jgi:alpha-methylacyl-CoA racemase
MGPLQGVKIVEFAGIGPGPFAAMMLADMGADVLRIDRTKKGGGGGLMKPAGNLLNRNRRSAAINLKKPEGVSLALRLVEKADALLEGFRPGVMERLGLGPETCLQSNPRLVYGRMTGWGQEGPLADAAGHDINYISLAGVLHHIGTAGGPPVPPLNLVGDFGGGGMMLAFGVVCALLEAGRSGRGQVVDAAMVDGAAVLMTLFHAMRRQSIFFDERGTNSLDSGAHFYNAYRTRDGKYVSIGSIEPQFYAKLLELTGLAGEELPDQRDPAHWPALKEKLQAVFETRTRDEWCEIMEGSDVCFAPVLTIPESMEHPHLKARNTYVEVDGIPQPAPAPRFSRTPGTIDRPPPLPGQHTDEALREWGIPGADISRLHAAGAIE